MSTFRITTHDDAVIDVEAEAFNEKGAYTIFSDVEGEQVYAAHTTAITSIQRVAQS